MALDGLSPVGLTFAALLDGPPGEDPKEGLVREIMRATGDEIEVTRPNAAAARLLLGLGAPPRHGIVVVSMRAANEVRVLRACDGNE